MAEQEQDVEIGSVEPVLAENVTPENAEEQADENMKGLEQ